MSATSTAADPEERSPQVSGHAPPTASTRSRARLLGPVVTALLSVVALIESMRLWEWTPGTPLGLAGDNTSVNVWVSSIITYGPYSDNPRLGAPFGQNLGWYPTADDVHFLVLWVLGHVWSSAFTVTAVYFFIGFPLAALTMYWLARTERVAVLPAVLVGVLFAVLPGHQTRYPHLFLAAYWVVPLGVWLALRISRGLPVYRAVSDDGWGVRRPVVWLLRSLFITVIVALGGVYYSAFAVILMTCALGLRLLSDYRRQELYSGLRVILLVTSITGLSLARMHLRTLGDVVVGSDPLGRSPADSEAFGGKIIDLLLPWPNHRVPALGAIAQRYDAATQTTFEPSALGLVAVAGCGVALVATLTLGMSRPSSNPRREGLWIYGVFIVVAAAFYTKDGLGALFAMAVTPGIRTWLRLYVAIALFGLLAIGLIVTRLHVERGLRWAGTACALLLLVGILDQTSPSAAPNYQALRQQLATFTSLTGQMESRLPQGCAVFQLPIIKFPDGEPQNRLGIYDLEIPYLASDTLRWSFAAIEGTTDAEWQSRLPQESAALTDALAESGFCAVSVDTYGFSNGTSPVGELSTALGEPFARSDDGRLVAFDLRLLRAQLVGRYGAAEIEARGNQILHPFSAPISGG